MAFQKVYCSQNEFNELFLTDVNNDILEKIITDFCDIYMDIEESEIIVLSSENPIFKRLLKRDSGTIISAINEFESIRSNSFFPFLNDILILNKETNTGAIRNDFGILALKSDDKEYLESLDYHFGYSFNKGKDKENPFKTWSDVFKSKKIEPLNSAIIIDNFLWNNIDDFHNENLENLYPIFENLIPKTLKIPFHISIITSNNKSCYSKKFIEKLNKIVKNLKASTGVNIEISLSTHTDAVKDDIHERVILTNYHYIYSDKGFNVFKDNKIILSTKGDRNWVFKDVRNYYGEIRKHHQIENLNMVKKRILSNQKIDTDVIFNLGNTNNPLLN